MTTTLTATEHDRFVVEHEANRERFAAHENGKLEQLRSGAIERFATLGFPTIQMEEWRFTNVSPIARTPFRLDLDGDAEVAATSLEPCLYPDCATVVLVNGRFRPDLSDLSGLPLEVIVTGLAEALENRYELVEKHLGTLASYQDHAFVALNTAFLNDGVFVYLPRNAVVERPVNIISLAVTGGEAIAFFPRNLIIAEEGSQATVVEQFATAGEGNYLVAPVTEIAAGPNSHIDHYKLQRESVDAFHMATFQLRLDRDSTVSSHSISWGGGLVRNDVNAVLDGEGCEATLNGLYLVEGKQLVDNHMRVDHAKPHCDSHELYKGILEGSSRAVFNGRIYVHPGAQQTDAKQTNRNLLISPDALCNSNPQLEIFADDVKCTHGSTVGQLDETAIFYLRSRGIGEEAARSLLTYAFAADIVERIQVAPVRQDLEEFLFRRLPKGEVVRQAV